MPARRRVHLDDVSERFRDVHIAVRSRLHAHGLRSTPARLAVVTVLSSRPTTTQGQLRHLSAHDVHCEVARMGINLDETTVYRALGALEHVNLLHGVAIIDHPAVYGLAHPVHHHALCVRCGVVRSIDARDLTRIAQREARTAGFELDAKESLIMSGTCRSCVRRPSARRDQLPPLHASRELADLGN